MDPVRIYSYLALAREHVFGWARPLSDEQYRSEHPIGLGSIARTLHHTMAAEWQYTQRLNGRTDPLGKTPLLHDPEVTSQTALPFPDLEQAWREQAVQTGGDIARAVADDAAWSTQRLYHTEWDGKPYAYWASPSDMCTQLAFHEMHHRAQAMHMLRRLGVETGEIDFNALMFTPAEKG